MSGYYCAQCAEVKPLFPETPKTDLALPCLGRVPFDPEVAALCDRGELETLDPARPAASAAAEIFEALERALA
jgi:hypothetical protein